MYRTIGPISSVAFRLEMLSFHDKMLKEKIYQVFVFPTLFSTAYLNIVSTIGWQVDGCFSSFPPSSLITSDAIAD